MRTAAATPQRRRLRNATIPASQVLRAKREERLSYVFLSTERQASEEMTIRLSTPASGIAFGSGGRGGRKVVLSGEGAADGDC